MHVLNNLGYEDGRLLVRQILIATVYKEKPLKNKLLIPGTYILKQPNNLPDERIQPEGRQEKLYYYHPPINSNTLEDMSRVMDNEYTLEEKIFKFRTYNESLAKFPT